MDVVEVELFEEIVYITNMEQVKKIAFICVHNSCRSQIAEALGKKYLSDIYDVDSAGTETKPQINQDAVRIMKELYTIDILLLEEDLMIIRDWMIRQGNLMRCL